MVVYNQSVNDMFVLIEEKMFLESVGPRTIFEF